MFTVVWCGWKVIIVSERERELDNLKNQKERLFFKKIHDLHIQYMTPQPKEK